jgi:hypothetical protein
MKNILMMSLNKWNHHEVYSEIAYVYYEFCLIYGII